MFDLPTQQIRACDGSAPLAKPAKRSGSNARKQRVEATAEAPVVIKPKAEKPVRAKIGARLRAMVLERDKFACVRCGQVAGIEKDGTPITLHVDHIKPVAQGGTNCESNLQTLCSLCNVGKGARSEPIDNTKIVRQLAELVGKSPKGGARIKESVHAQQRRPDVVPDDRDGGGAGGPHPRNGGVRNAQRARAGRNSSERRNRASSGGTGEVN